MALGFRIGNYSVYVYDERGQPHHLPHAHIKHGGQLVSSVFLLSLEVFHAHESLPRSLTSQIQAKQADLLTLWEVLNSDD